MTHRIVRSLMTVFMDETGSETFDWANMKPVALAQAYTLSAVKNTTNLVPNDLADPAGASQWAVPEPSDKSWTLSTDALVLIADADNPEYDPTGKLKNDDIYTTFAEDTQVWIAITDSDHNTGDTVYKYGKAFVTGFDQNGTLDEWHTYTAAFTGVGPLESSFVIPA